MRQQIEPPRVLSPKLFSSGPPTNTGLGCKTNVREAEQNELKAAVRVGTGKSKEGGLLCSGSAGPSAAYPYR